MTQIHNCLRAQPLDSIISGKDPPAKRQSSNEGGNSVEESLSSDKEDNNVFTLSEDGNTFMEIAFKSKMNAASRKKKMV